MYALRSPLIWPQGKWSFYFFIYSLATRRCGSNSKSVVSEKTFRIHDDVIKWKHFLHHWPFVRGIHRPVVNSPHKDQWRRALMFSLICAWMNGWVNNGEAGDLRCHRVHYDVTVMYYHMLWIQFMGTSCEIALRWMPQNTFDGKSILVQVMAWCHQATSHYLSWYWPRCMSPYVVIIWP